MLKITAVPGLRCFVWCAASAVALVGCDAEHLPFTEALAGAESDDARRLVEVREIHLLYVGCTRARESLLITYSGNLTPYLARTR